MVKVVDDEVDDNYGRDNYMMTMARVGTAIMLLVCIVSISRLSAVLSSSSLLYCLE